MTPILRPSPLLCTVLSLAMLSACSPTEPPSAGAAGHPAAVPGQPTPQAVPATPRSEPAGAPQRELAAQTYLPAAPHAAARLHADQARMRIMPAPMPVIQEDRENYAGYQDNPVQLAQEQPVSTFGLDVDTGSYSNVRRLLNDGRLPPADAVRAEAFINYFDYGYPAPATPAVPFSLTTEIAPAPWNPQRQLLLVGIQGYRVAPQDIPAVNLVLLIDTSGSMADRAKLPLLKSALRQLVTQMRAQDRVAIVAYAGSAGLVLPSTPGDRHAQILAAIDGLQASGSTNGGAGLELAYAEAAKGLVKDGVNRIVLASDGDFNVGRTDLAQLKDYVGSQRKRGIALTTLGLGSGNYNDAMAMQLANAGDGSYHYIDSLLQARKVFASELSATLLTIAKDVKVQVEFNPARVAEYRLIGYEKRALAREDFNNDAVDAGELGAGANVTALYEITPAGAAQRIDALRYGQPARAADSPRDELAYVRIRYQSPEGGASRLIEQPVAADAAAPAASARLNRAAAAAAFAQWLRGGKYLDGYAPQAIAALARQSRGADPLGLQAEFANLVELAASLGTPAAR
ncbi:YfbK domain-containing protein [Bordetella bronchiseptica]|uniref:YfbK domain-containing protein n=1 Tax=Bordetella bronchiseptica TaxID=518 RepID=UPI00123B6512|nr:von Willebrand factor type A domain-containing protein [Bordetella bronchiseptica]QET72524.1 DUF3520 domain-containing protein [Bordetella bronchiseptica]